MVQTQTTPKLSKLSLPSHPSFTLYISSYLSKPRFSFTKPLRNNKTTTPRLFVSGNFRLVNLIKVSPLEGSQKHKVQFKGFIPLTKMVNPGLFLIMVHLNIYLNKVLNSILEDSFKIQCVAIIV